MELQCFGYDHPSLGRLLGLDPQEYSGLWWLQRLDGLVVVVYPSVIRFLYLLSLCPTSWPCYLVCSGVVPHTALFEGPENFNMSVPFS